jgi:class I fructose-bisphosphate aldolase
MEPIMVERMPLERCGLAPGKKARLHRIPFDNGLGNGTAIFLPYDQGFEHGPRDFFANPITTGLVDTYSTPTC